jgi:hypothetical protein
VIVALVVGVWTFVAIVGIAVSCWALLDSYLDGRAQQSSGIDGLHEMIVRLNLRGAAASLLLHTFFLLLGIRAYLVAPATSGGFFLVASGYILVAATNVRAVGLNQLDRWRWRRGKMPA